MSQIFWEHETPPVINSLICNSREALLEWDFSSTNKTTKAEMPKAPHGWGPLKTNSPEGWHGGTKRMLLVTLCFESLSYWAGCQTQAPSSWGWLEMAFSLVRKPNSQDKEQNERQTFLLAYGSSHDKCHKRDIVRQWMTTSGKEWDQ